VQRQISPHEQNFLGLTPQTALQLERTDTVCPDRLSASFDLGFDRVVDGDEGLDVREGAGTNENLSTARLGL